jgi:hypothetical protein
MNTIWEENKQRLDTPAGALNYGTEKRTALASLTRTLQTYHTVHQTFLAFYGTLRFITLFTTARYFSPSSATFSPGHPILPLPHPQCYPTICVYVFQILSFFRTLQTKNTDAFCFPPMRATFSAHLIVLNDQLNSVWRAVSATKLQTI